MPAATFFMDQYKLIECENNKFLIEKNNTIFWRVTFPAGWGFRYGFEAIDSNQNKFILKSKFFFSKKLTLYKNNDLFALFKKNLGVKSIDNNIRAIYIPYNDIQDQIQGQAAGAVNYRLPSYGVFSTALQTNYWFGLPRDVNFAGLSIDVDRLAVQASAKDNDRVTRVNFIRTIGARSSAMEHSIPEQMFSTEDNPAQGISAMKALAIAGAQGQRIWTIDPSNLSAALAAINLSSEIENEIRNAVLAGKVATAHEQPVNFAGGTNAGYLLIDPDTGGGAYLIASGASGGFLDLTDPAIIGTLSLTDVIGFLLSFTDKMAAVATSIFSAYNGIRDLIAGNCTADTFQLIFMISTVIILTALLIAFAFVAAPLIFSFLFGLGVLFFLEEIDRNCNA